MANEKRLIDVNALLLEIEEELAHESPFFTTEQNELIDCGLRIAAKDIRHQPTVDAVSRGVHDQVRWERDIAIEQLESYGISLGEKADVAKVVHGRWVSSGCGFDCCSECRKVYTDGYFTAMGIKPRAQFNYCPNCGAKMDGGNEDG